MCRIRMFWWAFGLLTAQQLTITRLWHLVSTPSSLLLFSGDGLRRHQRWNRHVFGVRFRGVAVTESRTYFTSNQWKNESSFNFSRPRPFCIIFQISSHADFPLTSKSHSAPGQESRSGWRQSAEWSASAPGTFRTCSSPHFARSLWLSSRMDLRLRRWSVYLFIL